MNNTFILSRSNTRDRLLHPQYVWKTYKTKHQRLENFWKSQKRAGQESDGKHMIYSSYRDSRRTAVLFADLCVCVLPSLKHSSMQKITSSWRVTQGKSFQFSVGMTGKSVEQTQKLEPCQIRNEPVLTVSGGLLRRDLSSQELRDITFNFH